MGTELGLQHAAFYEADQQRRPWVKPLRSSYRSQTLFKGQASFPIRPRLAPISRDEQGRAQHRQNIRLGGELW